MSWIVTIAIVLVLYVVAGLDDWARNRAEARAAIARARSIGRLLPPPVTYRQAHERMHAAHRALLPHHHPTDRTSKDR